MKVLSKNSRDFAFTTSIITKSGEFVNYVQVPNIFINTKKIHCNIVTECW